MPELDLSNFSQLHDIATAETYAATQFAAGDEYAYQLLKDFTKAGGNVARHSREAITLSDRVVADDTIASEGKARMLREHVTAVRSQSYSDMEALDNIAAMAEGHFGATALKHDTRDDAALRAEVDNYAASFTSATAANQLIALASDIRMATFLAGPYGASVAARFGVDHGAIVRAALRTVTAAGTPAQRNAAKAFLMAPKALRRIADLHRGGHDSVVGELNKRAQPTVRDYVGPSTNLRGAGAE